MDGKEWSLSRPAYQLDGAAVVEQLGVDPESGLTDTEAEMRRSSQGPNTLQETGRQPAYQLLIKQFRDPLIAVLFVATLLAWYLGDLRGSVILMAIILINAAIGFYQEFHAEQLLERLKAMVQSRGQALRDGELAEVDASDLVRGDIVLLEEGAAVPADLRLLESQELATNDFMLTGESLPQDKDADAAIEGEVALSAQDNLVFMGTTVARGSAKGVVVATGMDSAIGEIATVGQGIERDQSPLQQEMGALAMMLTRLAGLIALALFLINMGLRADEFADTTALINASLLFAIGVAAACVPQGLPAQITVALSRGVSRLARENAVVKRLSAVETLGCTTVICSDKTGTITANQMTIVRAWFDGRHYEVTGRGYDPEGEILADGKALSEPELAQAKQFFQHGLLASNGRTHEPDEDHAGWYALGDPTEAAFMPLAIKAGLDPQERLEGFAEIAELPFDSRRKRMTIVREHNDQRIGYMKGATSSVLEACSAMLHDGELLPLDDTARENITQQMQQLSAESLRIIALAYRDFPAGQNEFPLQQSEQEFVFVGLVGMLDPPREGVSDALEQVRAAQVRVFMLTGDGPITAEAIAVRIGMPDGQVVTDEDLRAMDETQLREAVSAESVVFSRVSPRDKYRIVRLLKSMGEVVAVTGDGVNDTLSLKRADIGVAMGQQGSDVAKEAAEIVLTDDDFTTLVIAIREGRTIFQNLSSVILSSITSNIGELVCVCTGFIGAALGMPIPITAVQILSVDLIGEMLPLMALTFDPAEEQLMRRPPRRLGEHIINRQRLGELTVFGVLMGLGAYFSFAMVLATGGSVPMAQAGAFVGIVLIQYMNILSRRTAVSLFGPQLFSNRPLWGALIVSFIAVASITGNTAVGSWFGFEPLRLQDWFWPVLAAGAFLGSFELKKWWGRRR